MSEQKRGGGGGGRRRRREKLTSETSSQPKNLVLLKKPTSATPPTTVTPPTTTTTQRHSRSIHPDPKRVSQQHEAPPKMLLRKPATQQKKQPTSTTPHQPLTTSKPVASKHSHVKVDGFSHLISNSMEFHTSAKEILSDATDFAVIGVIGRQGVGKSTLLSMLFDPTIVPGSSETIFKTSAFKSSHTHTTSGINMARCADRHILLDVEPFVSGSVLERISSETSGVPSYLDKRSLQLLLFLLNVCHVVLVVQDFLPDLYLRELLKAAQTLAEPSPAAVLDGYLQSAFVQEDASNSDICYSTNHSPSHSPPPTHRQSQNGQPKLFSQQGKTGNIPPHLHIDNGEILKQLHVAFSTKKDALATMHADVVHVYNKCSMEIMGQIATHRIKEGIAADMRFSSIHTSVDQNQHDHVTQADHGQRGRKSHHHGGHAHDAVTMSSRILHGGDADHHHHLHNHPHTHHHHHHHHHHTHAPKPLLHSKSFHFSQSHHHTSLPHHQSHPHTPTYHHQSHPHTPMSYSSQAAFHLKHGQPHHVSAGSLDLDSTEFPSLDKSAPLSRKPSGSKLQGVASFTHLPSLSQSVSYALTARSKSQDNLHQAAQLGSHLGGHLSTSKTSIDGISKSSSLATFTTPNANSASTNGEGDDTASSAPRTRKLVSTHSRDGSTMQEEDLVDEAQLEGEELDEIELQIQRLVDQTRLYMLPFHPYKLEKRVPSAKDKRGDAASSDLQVAMLNLRLELLKRERRGFGYDSHKIMQGDWFTHAQATWRKVTSSQMVDLYLQEKLNSILLSKQ